MIHALTSAVRAALIERMTLLLNHVLAAESVATERLRGHAGRVIALEFEDWPALLPPMPQIAFRVTPAGLLEHCVQGGAEAAPLPDLRLCVDAANPALALAQWSAAAELPRVEIQGDAQFAADLSWLLQHLRWDVQDDLARMIGQAPAHEVARIGRLITRALRSALALMPGAAARADAGRGAAR